MATSYRQDKEFIESVIGTDLLQNAIEWIGKNLSPDDIFSSRELEGWAEENGYKKSTEE